MNIPLARDGGIKYTAGIPGSGMSWSYQEKDQAAHQDSRLIQGHESRGAKRLWAALAGLIFLLAIALVFSKRDSSDNYPNRKKANKTLLARPEEVIVSDVSIGPVTCTPDKTALQCRSSGAFVYYTINNNSKSQICSIRGSITYVFNGHTYGSGGSGSLFLGLYDNSDKCLEPGQKWRSVGGQYLSNSNWARGGLSSPKIEVNSVESNPWWK